MTGTLSKIWNNLKVSAAASDLFPVPYAVREEMERAGWTFDVKPVTSINPYAGAGSIIVMMEIKSPEGHSAHGAEPGVYEQYRKARKDAAQRVYSPI